jgi:hypothetical protein
MKNYILGQKEWASTPIIPSITQLSTPSQTSFRITVFVLYTVTHTHTHTHRKSSWQLYADTNTRVEKFALGDKMQRIKIRTLKATQMACRKLQSNIRNES